MTQHSRHYEQAIAVPQIDPAEARDDVWQDATELLPKALPTKEGSQSKNVLVWCKKRDAVFSAAIHFEEGLVYWFARSLEDNFTEIQHHVKHVTHWRPIPKPPPQT